MTYYCRPLLAERWHTLGFEDMGTHYLALIIDGAVRVTDENLPEGTTLLSFCEFIKHLNR